ncbi:vp1054 [Adoxophyes orana granulovirus]|uniref:Vp1054 n=1 Tax=Adoxophyes orana granulovirus TaxID=170617 RepID=Q7T9Q0_GVAO|nr:vp1054 [Adoxophyes orana granulovirus]AAP85752.1 vp1054 [Adoxophyes orana granulovirus]AJA91757.1 VP1054 [Adoxophyes orana granulovirus]
MTSLEDIVTARLTPTYTPLIWTKKHCRLHQGLNNCVSVQKKTNKNQIIYHHYTIMDSRYCDLKGDTYYQWLLSSEEKEHVANFKNGYQNVCEIVIVTEKNDPLRVIEEAGETNISLLRQNIKTVHEYLNDKRNKEKDNESKFYVLFKNMHLQCLYSNTQCVILPCEMYCLYKDGEEPYVNNGLQYFTIPEYEESVLSQDIYKAFLVYNTVLTMMLKEFNPFNDKNKVISKIIESVGLCDGGVEKGKRNRIRICSLNFGSVAPGHVMCPPKDIVKVIYKYSKWRLNPKNYTRYYRLLYTDTLKSQENLLEWSVFINNFKAYFFPE